MNRAKRDRIIQRVFWSPLGLRAVAAGDAFAKRWSSIVLNRSVSATTNGETWLPELLPNAPLIIDVGFHRGEFSHEVLRIRPEARVIGFEPAVSMRELYATLHSPDPRIRMESVALSDAPGESTFHDDASGLNSLAPIEYSDRTVSYSVETTTLDHYAESNAIDRIDMLKIDVEGYDLHVLEGAPKLLDRQAIEVFMFEYNQTWVPARRYLRDACEYLKHKSYSLFRLYNGFLSPFTYTFQAERFDVGAMYVGVSQERLGRGGIPIRRFPATP